MANEATGWKMLSSNDDMNVMFHVTLKKILFHFKQKTKQKNINTPLMFVFMLNKYCHNTSSAT